MQQPNQPVYYVNQQPNQQNNYIPQQQSNQQVYNMPQQQSQISSVPSSSVNVTNEFSTTFITTTWFYRLLNLMISAGFLLVGFAVCSKVVGDEREIQNMKPIKGKKSLFLVFFIYFVFLVIGLGVIPGIVDWAPALVYFYLGQYKKILILFVLRISYVIGLVQQFIIIFIIVGIVTGGVGSAVSTVFHVLWFLIMFIQVKGCLFDQISLVRALNRDEEILETQFSGTTSMLLVSFGMINIKYNNCCGQNGDSKTSICVTKH